MYIIVSYHKIRNSFEKNLIPEAAIVITASGIIVNI